MGSILSFMSAQTCVDEYANVSVSMLMHFWGCLGREVRDGCPVVTLFNAVTKQQKAMENAVAEVNVLSNAKKAKVDKDAKQNFVRLLKTETTKVGGSIASGKSGNTTAAAAAPAKWDVLSDTYGMAAKKMKDWDKVSESSDDDGGGANRFPTHDDDDDDDDDDE